jgi:hypothetical protein
VLQINTLPLFLLYWCRERASELAPSTTITL